MSAFFCHMALSVFGIILLSALAQGSGVETGVHWKENQQFRDKMFDNPLKMWNEPTELISCVIYCLGVSECKHVLLTHLSGCWLFKDLQGAYSGVGSRTWSPQTSASAPVTTTIVPKVCPGNLSDYKYNAVYDSCLYIKQSPYKNYHDAKEDCVGDGARLVVVDTKEKHQEMNNFERHWIWIGAEKISGSWMWNNGVVVDTSSRVWVPGQPSDKASETCMFVFPSSGVAGFDDNNCITNNAYMCEYVFT